MNDLEFRQRAYANPQDESDEFLAAILESPERQQLLSELQAFNVELTRTLLDVPDSNELKQRLLDPVALSRTLASGSASESAPDIAPDTTPDTAPDTAPDSSTIRSAAANEGSFWRRALPVAAGLILAISIAFNYWPTSNRALEQEVFAHIYEEIDFLEMDDNVSMATINGIMANVGVQFKERFDFADIEVQVASDCLIAREHSLHMVVKGEKGPITMMIIPNFPVKNEFSISDSRFEGIISPTPNGNLVVIGEKDESLDRYTILLASNINW